MRTEYSHFTALPSAWVVVNTQPHKERLALENLALQGYRTYCPKVRKLIRHARRSQEVLRPLFPSYLFVHIDPSKQRWRAVFSTFGVRSVICSGEVPSLLDDGFIESLKAREIDGVIVRPASPHRVGQQVRMAGGAFDGLVATIVAMDEKDRLQVLIELLSRPVKVKVDAKWVASA